MVCMRSKLISQPSVNLVTIAARRLPQGAAPALKRRLPDDNRKVVLSQGGRPVVDTIDTRMRHLRSRTPQNTNTGLAPDQQSVELEPLTDSDTSGTRGFSRRSFLSGLGAAGVLAGAAPL